MKIKMIICVLFCVQLVLVSCGDSNSDFKGTETVGQGNAADNFQPADVNTSTNTDQGAESETSTGPEWNINDIFYVYEVGPGLEYEEPSQIPWDELMPSTLVRIHWRPEPYRTKWVITTPGTQHDPVVILGVSQNGVKPVISGEDAVTRLGLYYLNEGRSVIKIGNYTGVSDTDRPSYVYVENLDIRSARPEYSFTNRYSEQDEYSRNAAAVHIEEGDNIFIKGCVLHDCGNGLFSSHFTQDVVINSSHIYDNGIEGRYYEHNAYTESLGIVYEYNLFGPLRDGCDGNNLKDRSAGTIIRYNWIEGGNRQLDLVDTDDESLFQDPSYRETFVYGNILIEPDNEGNSQIIHYGGDNTNQDYYRRGVLYLYHNTIISKRSDNTTLVRLSTDDVTADIRNNIIYTAASPGHLALTNGRGVVRLYYNWLTEDYRDSFESTSPEIQVSAGNITGTDPGFTDFSRNLFHPSEESTCINAAGTNADAVIAHPIEKQYVVHCSCEDRTRGDDGFDIGGFELD